MNDRHLPVQQPEAERQLAARTRFDFAEPEPFDPDAPTGPGLKRYVSAVGRYKWMVAAIAVAGGIGGFVASRYVPLDYVAEATLMIHVPGDANAQAQGPIRSAQLLSGPGWVELLRSFVVLEPVVMQERLYLKHAARDASLFETFAMSDTLRLAGSYRLISAGGNLRLERSDGTLVETARPGEPIGSVVGYSWQPKADVLAGRKELSFTVVHPRTAASDLRGQVMTSLHGGSFLSLRYMDRDPERAARVVNALSDRFVAMAADLKRAQLVELRDTLNSQLEYARRNMEEAELALEGFKVATITLPSEPATPVSSGTAATRPSALNNFFSMKIEREELVRDRDALRRAVAISASTVSLEAMTGIAAVRQSPELSQALQETAVKRAALRALRQQYTDDYQPVRRAVEELEDLEQREVPRLAGRLLEELDARLNVLDGFVNSASNELRDIPPRAIEEARLSRSVASAERLYNDLRQRYENARLATETSVADVRSLSSANVPHVPVNDLRLKVIFMSFLGALALGIGIAVFLEWRDPRIRYPEEVSEGMRLTILGAMPDMKRRRRPFSGAPAEAELIEALRGVRLNLAHAYGAAGPIVVTVTSPGSGDGKSFLTSNLGAIFGRLGYRTLVIDGDTRRGTQHRVLKIDRRPGLTDFLAGNASLTDVVRDTDAPGLQVIPSGARHGNTPELLSNRLMGELLAYARSQYDVILIDSPPLGAGVDPLVLATISGNVVVVMRAGQTERELAAAKLASLAHLPIRVLGAVLNGIQQDDAYRYYSYLPGYEAASEDGAEKARSLLPA